MALRSWDEGKASGGEERLRSGPVTARGLGLLRMLHQRLQGTGRRTHGAGAGGAAALGALVPHHSSRRVIVGGWRIEAGRRPKEKRSRGVNLGSKFGRYAHLAELRAASTYDSVWQTMVWVVDRMHQGR
jgi:hypothetical protein